MPDPKSKATRKTIGVVAARVGRMIEPAFMSGVLDAAEARDVNVVFFVGGTPTPIIKPGELTPSYGFYDLLKSEFISGYLYAADIAYDLTKKEIRAFHGSLPELPAVGNSVEDKGILNISADNDGGMRTTIRHLIKEHKYRRVAFIRGPEEQLDAQQRFEAYKKELSANDIRYDERLVVDGDFSPESGRAAMRVLLDERKVRIDAVAAANDRMAFGALDVLQSRGIRVPAEIAVTGFDDVVEAQLLSVPLTTVRQSFYSMGYQSLELLLKRIGGETLPRKVVVPTETIVRWSCGCLPESVHKAVVAPAEVARTGRLENKRDAAVKALLSAGGIDESHPEVENFKRLFGECWDVFLAVMHNEANNEAFLNAIEAAVTHLQQHNRDAAAWHNLISVMRRHTLAGISEKDDLLQAENLFQQARMMTGELSQRNQAYHRQELEQQEESLQGFSFTMAPAMSLSEIGAAVEKHFDTLNVPRCYAMFYSDMIFPQSVSVPPSEKYRLLLKYDDDGLELPPNRPIIPTGRLLPEGKFPSNRRFNAIVMPLSLADKRFGFFWLEMGTRDWEVYIRIRNLISSALLRTMLVEQREMAQLQVEHLLEEAKESAVDAENLALAARHLSSVLDLNELPPQILEQLEQILPFKRAWLVLSNAAGITELAASRGVTEGDGEETLDFVMKDRGLYETMVETGEPILINHIAPADNLQLPKKFEKYHSWLGVPLVSKGRVTGMLLLARLAANAFGVDEKLLATTYAVQTAISLENARLYDEVTRFNQVMERMVQQRVQELNEAYATLYKLDKNKTDFISVSAHELRTPLTVMKGYLGMLRANKLVDADAMLTQAIDGLLQGTDRLHFVVNNMLDVARLEGQTIKPRFEKINLGLIARIIQKEYSRDLEERNLRLTIDESMSELPIVSADGELMQKALDSVIINAIKFTPDGGSITVRGQMVEDARMGQCPEIQVQDSGIGIAAEHHKLIFEKLYQVGKVELHSSGRTKFKGGGPGLGLAIAAGIVRAHSGRIWVESPGHDEEKLPGSTFFIRIPLTHNT